MMQKKKTRVRSFFFGVLARMTENKISLAVLVGLGIAVLVVLGVSAAHGRWDAVFTGALTLGLLFIPPLAEECFSIRLPATLEVFSYLFIFSAGILGEIGGFYGRFPLFDDILHAFNGYMFAAFGFCLSALLTKRAQDAVLPPFLVTLLAFCFSMSVGVAWELFEFGADRVLHTDMQKDTPVHRIDTVLLPGTGAQKVRHLQDIVQTEIVTKGGRVRLDAYLDIGLADTMTDLAVNLLGALLFCVLGYLYLKRGRGRIARHFIPVAVKREREF